MNVTGYKVFNPDWTCRGKQYTCPGKFEEDIKLDPCKSGMHFCKKLADCFGYYDFDPNNKVAEVRAYGMIAENGDKCCTDKLEIVRELSWHEVLDLVNTGKGCTGRRNTGSYNTGHRNTGSYNTGNCNTGSYNTGHYNTGSYNTGDYNTGNCNTGDYNTGNCNTGDYNTGDYNTGDYNTGDYNTGFFNTEIPRVRLFDCETDITFDDFLESEAYNILPRIAPASFIFSDNMTDEEKESHPEHETIGGYLKKNDVFEQWQSWWEALTLSQKGLVLDIPNFNAEKFMQITGIDVNREEQ